MVQFAVLKQHYLITTLIPSSWNLYMILFSSVHNLLYGLGCVPMHPPLACSVRKDAGGKLALGSISRSRDIDINFPSILYLSNFHSFAL